MGSGGPWTRCRIHARVSATFPSPWLCFAGCDKAEGKFWQMHRGTLLFSARWRSTLFKVYAGFFMPTLIDARCMARRYGQITLQLPESEAYYRHIPIRRSCLEGCEQPADFATTSTTTADIRARLILYRLALVACDGGTIAKMSRGPA